MNYPINISTQQMMKKIPVAKLLKNKGNYVVLIQMVPCQKNVTKHRPEKNRIRPTSDYFEYLGMRISTKG
jgi:hypothetical protein